MELELEYLVQRCQAGDDLAWEALVRSQESRVLGLCCHYVRDREDARDLAQEVFVRIYHRIGGLEQPERFVSWMLKIARNAAIDHTRRRKARPPAQDIPADEMYSLAADGPDPSEMAASASAKRLVHRALDGVGELHREILLLKDIQGLSVEEIASMLSLPTGTVKSRSSRARLELARVVAELEEGELEFGGGLA